MENRSKEYSEVNGVRFDTLGREILAHAIKPEHDELFMALSEDKLTKISRKLITLGIDVIDYNMFTEIIHGIEREIYTDKPTALISFNSAEIIADLLSREYNIPSDASEWYEPLLDDLFGVSVGMSTDLKERYKYRARGELGQYD